MLAIAVAPPVSCPRDRSVALYRELAEQAKAIPEVVNAAAVEDLPISDDGSEWSILVDGAPMASVSQAPSAVPQKVTPGYFDVMRIGLVRGIVAALGATRLLTAMCVGVKATDPVPWGA